MERKMIPVLTLLLATCSSYAFAGNPPAPVAVTGQTACYDDKGTQISCTGTGQDGELRAGYPAPAGRFSVDANGFVTDQLTGLMWMTPPYKVYNSFQDWRKVLTVTLPSINSGGNTDMPNGGYSDWRLANLDELQSLINYGQSRVHVYLVSKGFPQQLQWRDTYWTSTTDPASAPDGGTVETINLAYGSWYNNSELAQNTPPLFTRNAQAGAITLPKTGQAVSYSASDDGDVQKGLAWPSPRFSSTVNQTVTDNLTGLMWSKLGNVIMARDPEFDHDSAKDGKVTWSHALAYVQKLNAERYLGFTDWRLPNINELRSLYNSGASDNIAWLTSQGFQDVQSSYWTSTTAMRNASSAWIVSFLPSMELHKEDIKGAWKDQYTFYPVLPVRRVLHGTVETVLNPTTVAFCSPGGTGSTAIEAGSDWSANTPDGWIGLTGGTGNGDGTLSFSVAANPTGAHRSSTITVDGKTVTVLQAKGEFNDVANVAGNWVYPYACALYAQGITQGCNPDGPSYCPDNAVTREQMAAFIVRAKFTDNFSITSTTPYYNDVDPNSVYFKYIQKMREEGLAAANPGYNPSGLVTREQMAAFIIRALQGENFSYSQTRYFSDVPDTSVFYKYVQKMKDLGLTANNGVYDAAGLVTRAQMAAFLSRAFLNMK